MYKQYHKILLKLGFKSLHKRMYYVKMKENKEVMMSNVINGKMKKSINNFVQELNNKIKDLSDLHEQNRNLSINFERICDIVKRYIMGPPLGLRAGDILRSDILLFSKKDLSLIHI